SALAADAGSLANVSVRRVRPADPLQRDHDRRSGRMHAVGVGSSLPSPGTRPAVRGNGPRVRRTAPFGDISSGGVTDVGQSGPPRGALGKEASGTRVPVLGILRGGVAFGR